MDSRKEKEKILSTKSERVKAILTAEYRELDKEVKKGEGQRGKLTQRDLQRRQKQQLLSKICILYTG